MLQSISFDYSVYLLFLTFCLSTWFHIKYSFLYFLGTSCALNLLHNIIDYD